MRHMRDLISLHFGRIVYRVLIVISCSLLFSSLRGGDRWDERHETLLGQAEAQVKLTDQKRSTNPTNQDHHSSHILATVIMPQGQRLTVSDAEFEVAWRAQLLNDSTLQDTHAQRRITLDALIELKLLSVRAKELAYDRSSQALYVRAQAAVRHLLIDDFERKFQQDNLPQRYIDNAKRKNMGIFRHPELRRAVHLLIKPVTSSISEMTKTQAEVLRPIVKRVESDLKQRPITSADELKSRVDHYQAWIPKDYEVIFENLGRFALEGRFHRGFSEECFHVKTPRTLTEPIETPFGFHFVWIQEIIAPLDTSDEDIEAEVKKRLLPAIRKHEWKIFTYEISKDVEVKLPVVH